MSKVKVAFGEPIHGWLPIEVSMDSVSVAFNASYVYSSPHYLVTALTSLTGPTADQTVVWNTEPEEYEFTFSQLGDGNISLTIVEYPDRERIQSTQGSTLLSASGDYSTICLPFWRALRELKGRFSSKEWKVRWGSPFPNSELRKLTEALRDLHIIA